MRNWGLQMDTDKDRLIAGLESALAEKQKVLNNALKQLDSLEQQIRQRDLHLNQFERGNCRSTDVAYKRWYRKFRARYPERVKRILAELDIPEGEKFVVRALTAIRSDPQLQKLMDERRRRKKSSVREEDCEKKQTTLVG